MALQMCEDLEVAIDEAHYRQLRANYFRNRGTRTFVAATDLAGGYGRSLVWAA